MKEELAERLFMLLMEWENEVATKERLDIQFLSELKYDGYQQFTQGMRYVESLFHWIRQFDGLEEKRTAYNFIKKNLIFISEDQMMQLVSIAFTGYIKPVIVKEVKSIANVNKICDAGIKKNLYECYLNKTLFLGLSDGAHIDYFRRYNNFLDNEQIFMHYDFSKDKLDNMLEELKNRNNKYNFGKNIDNIIHKDHFNTFVLLDDFSASGISFARKQEIWKGKICKFVNNIKRFSMLDDNIEILVILYVSTWNAINYIKNTVNKFFIEEKFDNINFDIQAIQYIEKCEICEESDIHKLLKKYNDNTIIDKHFLKGKCDSPYLGFNECSIPLILYHNTPNNTFPILWNENKKETTRKALFPRITRHKEDV